MTLQFVIFRVGQQQYAVEIHRVSEVINYREITPLPAAPSFLDGMIDLRGSIIPVLDLRKRLGLTELRNTTQTRILVIRQKKKRIGLVVDSAEEVYPIESDDIKPPPQMEELYNARYVMAVASYHSELFVILDLDRMLTGAEQINFNEFVPARISKES